MLVNTKLWRKAQIEKWPKKKRERFRKTCCPKSQEPVLHKRVTLILLAFCSASVAVIGILLSVREGACMKMPKTPAKKTGNWGRIFKKILCESWFLTYESRDTEEPQKESIQNNGDVLPIISLLWIGFQWRMENGFQISNFKFSKSKFQISKNKFQTQAYPSGLVFLPNVTNDPSDTLQR